MWYNFVMSISKETLVGQKPTIEKRLSKKSFKPLDWIQGYLDAFAEQKPVYNEKIGVLLTDLQKYRTSISDKDVTYKDPNGMYTIDEEYRQKLDELIKEFDSITNPTQKPEQNTPKAKKEVSKTKKEVKEKQAKAAKPKQGDKDAIKIDTNEPKTSKESKKKGIELKGFNALAESIETPALTEYDSKIRLLLKGIKIKDQASLDDFIKNENDLFNDLHDTIKEKQREVDTDTDSVNDFINNHLIKIREVNAEIYKTEDIKKETLDALKEILNKHLKDLVELRNSKYRTFYPKVVLDDYVSGEEKEIYTNYEKKGDLKDAIKKYTESVKRFDNEDKIDILFSTLEEEAKLWLSYTERQQDEQQTQQETDTEGQKKPKATDKESGRQGNKNDQVKTNEVEGGTIRQNTKQKKGKTNTRRELHDHELGHTDDDVAKRHISASRRGERPVQTTQTSPEFEAQKQGSVIKGTNFNINTEQLGKGISLNIGKESSFSSIRQENTASVAEPEIRDVVSPTPQQEQIKIPMENLIVFEDDDLEKHQANINDTGFNTWFEKLFKQLEKRSQNTESEVQTISEWFSLYEAFKPYMTVLNTIAEDIRSNTTERTKLIITENYIGDLIYYAYENRYNPAIKQALDQIIGKIKNTFEDTKKQKEERTRLRKLKKIVQTNTDEKGKIKEIRTGEQVKEILETRGEKNDKETFEELKGFLHDMYYNYDYYSGGINHESDTDAIYSIANRYESNKKHNGEEISIFGKAVSFLRRRIHEVSADSLNKLKPLIQRLQKLNLVSKKGANDTNNRENSIKMSNLIHLMVNGEDLLLRYIKNPNETELQSSGFDEEGIKLVKIFKELFELFESTKHKTEKSKSLAKLILKDIPDTVTNIADDTENDMDSLDALLSSDSDYIYQKLEQEAEFQIAEEELQTLDAEIDRLATGTRAVSFENLRGLETKYTELATKLEGTTDLFTEKISLTLKKTELKLNELIIKKINKNDFSQLSEAFKHYDAIVINPSMEKDIKKQYIRELIDKLTTQTTTRMTPLKKAALSAIISKYTDILNTIN